MASDVEPQRDLTIISTPNYLAGAELDNPWQDVLYPQLRISSSLARVVSQATSAISTMPPTSKDAASSLEDSTYLLLDESFDEEDAMSTDSLEHLSHRDHIPDDLSSVTGTEVSIGDDDSHMSRSLSASAQFEHVAASGAALVRRFDVDDGDNDGYDTYDEDDEGCASRMEDSLVSQSSLDRASSGYERIDDSNLTARPHSPPIEPDMLPSMHQSQSTRLDGISSTRGEKSMRASMFARVKDSANTIFGPTPLQNSAVTKILLTFLSVVIAWYFKQYYVPEIKVDFEAVDVVADARSFLPLPTYFASTTAPANAPSPKPADAVFAHVGTDLARIVQTETSLSVPIVGKDASDQKSFSIHVLEQTCLMLQMPAHIKRLKKLPQVDIMLVRHTLLPESNLYASPIPTEITFNGSDYLIKLHPWHASGKLFVLVDVKRPLLFQALTVDLGRSNLISYYSTIVGHGLESTTKELQRATTRALGAVLINYRQINKIGRKSFKALEKSRGQAVNALHTLQATTDGRINNVIKHHREALQVQARSVAAAMRKAHRNVHRIAKVAGKRVKVGEGKLRGRKKQGSRERGCQSKRNLAKKAKKLKKTKRNIRQKMKTLQKRRRAASTN